MNAQSTTLTTSASLLSSILKLAADVDDMAVKCMQYLWRLCVHVVYYRSRPGKIRPRPLKSNLTEQSVLVTTPDLAAGVRQMWFELSNQHFNQRQVLTQDQLEMVAQAAEAHFDGPVYGIQWAGQMYRAWQAPAITLHRFPDDAVIPTQRRWSPGR